MDLPARVRILVETPRPTALSPIEQRLRSQRPEVRHVSGVPLPEGIVARGHVLANLTLADLEAIVSGYAQVRPTSLVIEPQRRPRFGSGLHFHARTTDGAAIGGTIRIRLGSTATNPPTLVVDVVLRADEDADATDHREAGPPPAAVLGAVLAELRDLRHRLRASPMTARQAVDHVEAILAVVRDLEGAQDEGQLRRASRSAAPSTARRVAQRYAGVILRGPKEEVISQCSDGSTVTAAEVRELLRADGHDVDAVAFLESSWPAQTPFVTTRAGKIVVNGTVVIDCKLDGDTIRAFAEIRIDEVFGPARYSSGSEQRRCGTA